MDSKSLIGRNSEASSSCLEIIFIDLCQTYELLGEQLRNFKHEVQSLSIVGQRNGEVRPNLLQDALRASSGRRPSLSPLAPFYLDRGEVGRPHTSETHKPKAGKEHDDCWRIGKVCDHTKDTGSEKSPCTPRSTGGLKEPVGATCFTHHPTEENQCVGEGMLMGHEATIIQANSEDFEVIPQASPAHITEDESRSRFCLRRFCQKLGERREFEFAATSLIIVNAIAIGLYADWSIKNIGSEDPPFYKMLELVFMSLFSLELLVRMLGEGFYFIALNNVSIRWNILDSFVVGAAILETLILQIFESYQNITFMRTVRLLRIVRVLRLLRVMRFFAELRLMVAGIVNSMKALCWCVVLLSMILYMFSLVVLQEISGKLSEDFRNGVEVEMRSDSAILDRSFGSMIKCIYTLFLCTTSGITWGEVANALFEVSGHLGMFFLCYFGFVFFCVFNVVTSVFVAYANSFSKMDLDNLVLDEAAQRDTSIAQMRQIFKEVCAEGSDELNLREFMIYIHKPAVQAYFRHLGLDVARDNAGALFNLIDVDGSGTLRLPEFVDGCAQFVGQARQLDIARLRHELRYLTNLMKDFAVVALKSDVNQEAIHEPTFHQNSRASYDLASTLLMRRLTVEPSDEAPRLVRTGTQALRKTRSQ